MNTRLAMSAALILTLFPLTPAQADPKTTAEIEITYLLEQIQVSGCEFNRNGIWYSSKTAHSHLSDKFEKMEAGHGIDTTEHFIETAASVSDDSGQPYKVRCDDGKAITSSQWLRDELVHFRTF